VQVVTPCTPVLPQYMGTSVPSAEQEPSLVSQLRVATEEVKELKDKVSELTKTNEAVAAELSQLQTHSHTQFENGFARGFAARPAHYFPLTVWRKRWGWGAATQGLGIQDSSMAGRGYIRGHLGSKVTRGTLAL
jgi:hypothetical protein